MTPPIQRFLIEKISGKKYLIKDLNSDFITPSGIISKKDLQGKKIEVISNKSKAFLVLEPSFPDFWESLHRGPQVVLQKDIGLILAKTGVNKNSLVVDAGGGSGALCLSLANVCQQVTAYENHPEHFAILQKNKELLGMKSLILKKQDVSLGIAEENLDLITLDLPEPWKVVAPAEKSLKTGGFLVVYLPNLLQVKEFIAACKESQIKVLETIELLERKWKIEERIMRPEFEMLGHTGFLTFCRKF